MLDPHLFTKQKRLLNMRDGYAAGLVEIGAKDKRVVVLTGDLAESTRADRFQKKFPDRFIECGVAEQNMTGIAAGLALCGKIPFVSSYAVFSPGRTWDQVRVAICYSNANVKIAGSHAGLSVGPDGATHQALEDLAIMRVLPNMTVVVPCDYEETRKTVIALAKMDGPAYFRFARSDTPAITTEKTPFKIGKHDVLLPGTDVTICACGPLVYEALLAARALARKKIAAEIINCHTLKPFDEATLVKSAKKTRCVVTVEEHQTIGGLFGAVSETLARRFPVPVEPVGMPNSFGESGEPEELLEKYGMTTEKIVEAARRTVERK